MALPQLSLTLTDAIDSWLSYREADGCKPATIDQYRHASTRFSTFMESHGVVTVDDVTKETLRDYRRFLTTSPVSTSVGTRHGKPLAPRTVHSYLRAVANFFNYLTDMDLLNGPNPVGKGFLPRMTRDPKRAPTDDEVSRLLDAVEKPEKDTSYIPAFLARGRALLWLMLDTGLRVSEIAALDVTDYDPKAGAVHVRTSKGGHSRWVYVSPQAKGALDLWLVKPREQLLRRSRWERGVDRRYFDALNQSRLRFERTMEGPLFVDRQGQRMTAHAVRIWLRHLCERAGVPIYRPHDLRRKYISRAAALGLPIPQLMMQVGHSKAETTMGYVVRDEDELRRAVAAASPLSAYRKQQR